MQLRFFITPKEAVGLGTILVETGKLGEVLIKRINQDSAS